MAGGAEILQEYLVKLGFQTDKLGLKKFDEGLSGISKSVLGVGGALAGMAVAAEVAVGKFASQMEELHYTSKLAGSSANTLLSLETAGKSVGLMGNELSDGIKKLNLQLINGTGAMQQFAASLGVDTKGKEAAEVYFGIAKAFRQMRTDSGVTGPTQALSADRLGMSAETYQLLVNTPGAIENVVAAQKELDDQRKAAGGDANKGGESAIRYMKSLRELGTVLSNVAGIIFNVVEPAFEGLNHFLTDALKGLGILITDPLQFAKNYKANLIGNGKNNRFVKGVSKPTANATSVSKPTANATSGDEVMHAIFNKAEGKYTSVNRGMRGGYNAGKEDLASMTLAQVMQAQTEHKFNAAGHYQIIGSTLQAAAKSMGLSGNEKFDAKLQDRIFNEFLISKKQPAIGAYANGKSNDKNAALIGVSNEWAAFTDPRTGKSHHAGVGNNKASVSVAEASAMLDSMRAARLGANGVNSGTSLVQNNTFNITGTDGKALSKSVIAAQSRTNGDAVRSLSTRVS